MVLSSTSIFYDLNKNQSPILGTDMVVAITTCLKFSKVQWQLCNHVYGAEKPQYLSSTYVYVETGLTVNIRVYCLQ